MTSLTALPEPGPLLGSKAVPGAPSPGATARLRLGFLAPEFPPSTGGMPELARAFAVYLASRPEIAVTVYSLPGAALPDSPLELRPALSGDLRRDTRLLERTGTDLWLALNAGLVPLAPRLEAPFFSYFHGNDFLEPWLACGHPWLERIRRPYAARLRHPLRRRAIRRAFPDLRLALTNSRSTAALIRRLLGVATERISVCPPGVDEGFFQQRARRPAGGPLRLLTVCRLTRSTARKNVDGVLRAVAMLRPRTPIRYTVVGSGDDLPRLQQLAARLGIAGDVDFRGRVSRGELLACYAAADLFVLASKATATDVEGFGLVYLEAAASGVPSLCSRQGGATDAVIEGENGLLLASSEPESIAAGIERYLADPDRFPPERVRAVAERCRWPTAGARIYREIMARL